MAAPRTRTAAPAIKPDSDAADSLAGIAVARFHRARDYRSQHIVFQGLSTSELWDRADAQVRREYTADDRLAMQEAFGFCPSRYYGLAAFKCQAVTAWRLSLVAKNLPALFTVAPTPHPDLDERSQERIRDQVRNKLLARMQEAGVLDPTLLTDARGRPARELERFLQEQVRQLKGVEEALVVAQARQAANRIELRMRDVLEESGFRQSYQLYATDAVKYGLGVMRFVPSAVVPTLSHTSRASTWRYRNRPQYKHVPTRSFFPVPDSDSLKTNTGNTEYAQITKAELIDLARRPNYFASVIRDIVEDFANRPRDWLDGTDDEDTSYWELDQTIPLLVHEGFFSGSELADYGIKGIDPMDYVSARVEVVGFRTIRAELIRMPGGADRTFYAAPYNKIGPNLLDAIGLPAVLWDNEQRINRLYHIYEHNVDWAARPPNLVNSSAFADPEDALAVLPGGVYDVQERFGANGVMPTPMTGMTTVSAQYHLLLTQINAIIRDSDEISGLPGFALGGAQGLGSASLGEYSQRISNSLRIVQQVLLNEDMFLTEDAMTTLFHWVVQEHPELLQGADVQVVVRGTTGLMQEDTNEARLQAALPLILNDQTGRVPEQVKQFAVRQVLDAAGIPVDALGGTDPLIETALAEAALRPPGGFGATVPQVPQLDGRSRAAQTTGALAAPDGTPASLAQGVGVPVPSVGQP